MLIGLCGAAGCGKDTLAYEMVMHDAYDQYRLADPIKRMLREFHIRDDVWDDHEKKEKEIPWLGRSPRFLAQTLGTEWGRDLINPNIWVILARGRWHHLNASGKGRMVVSDVRFKNEAEWIRQEKGVLVKIKRNNSQYDMDNPAHVSESGIPDALTHVTVYNDGTKDELRQAAWDGIRNWLGV